MKAFVDTVAAICATKGMLYKNLWTPHAVAAVRLAALAFILLHASVPAGSPATLTDATRLADLVAIATLPAMDFDCCCCFAALNFCCCCYLGGCCIIPCCS